MVTVAVLLLPLRPLSWGPHFYFEKDDRSDGEDLSNDGGIPLQTRRLSRTTKGSLPLRTFTLYSGSCLRTSWGTGTGSLMESKGFREKIGVRVKEKGI